MSNLETGLIGAVVVIAVVCAYHLYQTLNKLLSPLKKIAIAAVFIAENKKTLLSIPESIREVLDGANKINEDSVKANVALVNEVVKMRGAVEVLSKLFSNPQEAEREEEILTPQILHERHDKVYSDLLEQGVDPEIARLKAAEFELESLIAKGGIENIGIGE